MQRSHPMLEPPIVTCHQQRCYLGRVLFSSSRMYWRINLNMLWPVAELTSFQCVLYCIHVSCIGPDYLVDCAAYYRVALPRSIGFIMDCERVLFATGRWNQLLSLWKKIVYRALLLWGRLYAVLWASSRNSTRKTCLPYFHWNLRARKSVLCCIALGEFSHLR